MSLVISTGYAASTAEVWTPTKQNNSTVPSITQGTGTITGRTTAGTGTIEELSAAQAKAILAIVPADVTLAASSFLGNNTGAPAVGLSLTVAQAKALLAIAQADVAGLLVSSAVVHASLTATQAAAAATQVLAGRNTSNNAAATAKFNLGNDVSASAFEIQNFSSAHANANKTWLYTGGAYDLALGVNGAQNLVFAGATGIATFSAQVNAPTFNSTSARRFKRNIRKLRDAERLVLELRPVRYDFRRVGGQDQVGFIAEDVQRVLPGLVVKNARGQVLGLNYGNIVAVNTAALQGVLKRLARLERKAA